MHVIDKQLVAQEPNRSTWQRNLAVSHEKIGSVLLAQGDLSGALAEYRAQLAVTQRLVSTDQSHTGWQRDITVTYGKIGGVLLAQGNTEEAIENYQRRLPILDRLTKSDPRNATWTRDLAVSYAMIADVHVTKGKLVEAHANYRKSHAIWEQVAASDPSNVGWQLDLLWSHSRLTLFQDDAVTRIEFIVATLQRLKMEGKLTAEQERWLPYAEHALAAAKLGNAEVQWAMLNIYWQTASFTENPVRQASLVVAMLRKLQEENRLTSEQARWLPIAELELAKLRQRQP